MGASGIIWRNVPHEEILSQINGGDRGASVSELPAAYTRMAQILRETDGRLRGALVAAGASWEGQAAQDMQVAATPLAVWAEEADNMANETGQRTSQYGDQYAETRTAMPAAVPVPDGSWVDGTGLSNLPGVTTDHERAEAAADAAHEEAARRMEAYDNESYATVQTQYFSEPPQVVLEIAPTQTGAGPGIPGTGTNATVLAQSSIYTAPAPVTHAGGGGTGVSAVPGGQGGGGGTSTPPTVGGRPVPPPTRPVLPGPPPGPPAPGPRPLLPGPVPPGRVPPTPPPGAPVPRPPGGGNNRRSGDGGAVPPVVPGAPGGAGGAAGQGGRGGYPGTGQGGYGATGRGFGAGGAGFGPGAHGLAGLAPGADEAARNAAGKGALASLAAEEAAAARAAAAGRAGIPGAGAGGFGPMGGGARREEDGEHRRPDYLVETEDIWGDGTRVAPPVIGDRPSQ